MHRIADMLLYALVIDPCSNQFETSHDHHQQIAEVMRDAAGELA